MDQTPKTPYDQVPYESSAFPETHPDSLGTVGRLFGLNVAPVETSRVLELGCARGENIIPLAAALPNSEFIGIDFSATQIEFAKTMVQRSGLKNIKLLHMNILDVGAEFGQFDYIITHGIYSWVPKAVQEKIVSISKTNLAPNGVAYISYNTLPGWHLRGVLRDIMLYHAKQYSEPENYVGQARAFMEFISKSFGESDAPYARLIQHELALIRKFPDWFLFHDYLEEINDPVYFHQFVERAEAVGLQYLGDIPFAGMVMDKYPGEIRSTLQRISSNIVRLEQYKDFLANRTFRRTLLCHNEHRLNRNIGAGALKHFSLASSLRPKELGLDMTNSNGIEFVNAAKDKSIRVKDPVVKAAFLHLSFVWPRWVPFDEIHEVARARAFTRSDAPAFEETATRLNDTFLKAFLSELVELHISCAPFTVEVGEKPMVTGLARLQASRGGPIVNLRHEPIVLDEIVRSMLPFVDGAKREIELLQVTSDLMHQRNKTSTKEEVNNSSGQEIDPKACLSSVLESLSKNAFLVG